MEVIFVIVGALLLLGFAAVRILPEWERGVVLRLGRVLGKEKGPGVILLIPLVDKLLRVDTRIVTLQIPPQEIITRDNVTTRVNAVAYFRVVNAVDSQVQVADFMFATSQIAQTTLRSVLGQHELDELLGERDRINSQLQMIIDSQTGPWGIKVTTVEVKDVEIPQQMQRVIARQAEAERERRAKVINAEGEYQAASRLTDAAEIMDRFPVALQLRYLQTLLEIGANNNTTTLFPIPIDILTAFRDGGAPRVGVGNDS